MRLHHTGNQHGRTLRVLLIDLPIPTNDDNVSAICVLFLSVVQFELEPVLVCFADDLTHIAQTKTHAIYIAFTIPGYGSALSVTNKSTTILNYALRIDGHRKKCCAMQSDFELERCSSKRIFGNATDHRGQRIVCDDWVDCVFELKLYLKHYYCVFIYFAVQLCTLVKWFIKFEWNAL